MDKKRKLHIELWVKRSKVNLQATFWVHLFFDRISKQILVSSSSYFVYSLRMMKEAIPESFRTNCPWLRSVKVAIRKRLMTLPILVNCARHGALRLRFVINFWWFFFVLEYSLSIELVFLTFIIPGSRDIVLVVQTVQIDLQKFRFTAPDSNFAFVLINIAHNFYKMQKGHVISFYKMIQ